MGISNLLFFYPYRPARDKVLGFGACFGKSRHQDKGYDFNPIFEGLWCEFECRGTVSNGDMGHFGFPSWCDHLGQTGDEKQKAALWQPVFI